MNYFWWSGRKTERRAKRQDSWAFRESQNFEMIGGHYEKEAIYPKNTTKAQGKLRNVHGWHWKSLNEKSHPHFSGGGKAVKLKAWKLLWGPGLRRLQQFMREDPVRLMLLIYLWGDQHRGTFFHLKQVKAQGCVISTYRASSYPYTPDLWMKPGRGNSSPQCSVTTAGGFHLIAPPQQPVSMGWKQQETPADVFLCRRRATLITFEAHFTFLLSRRIFFKPRKPCGLFEQEIALHSQIMHSSPTISP